MMQFLRDTWLLTGRLALITWRMPIFVVLSITQPVLWMLLFGQLFQKITTMPSFDGDSYVQFLAPGIAIMTALFSAAYAGLSLLKDIEDGFFDRLLATPMSRGAFVSSRVVLAAGQVVAQAAVILLMALALGAWPRGGLGGLLLLFLAAALLAASFACFSCGLALVTRRRELVVIAMNFIVLPMTFLSSMIMHRELIPPWMQTVARFNPVDWAVIVARHGFEGSLTHETMISLVSLVGVTLACGLLAHQSFNHYQKTL